MFACKKVFGFEFQVQFICIENLKLQNILKTLKHFLSNREMIDLIYLQIIERVVCVVVTLFQDLCCIRFCYLQIIFK